MKKFFCILCAVALTAALAGCAKPAESASQSPVPTETTAPAASAEPTPEATSTPEPTQEPTQTATAAPADVPAGAPDISSAIEANTTTDTAPAAIGQWVKTARYATEDETYHTVYVRVTKVTTQAADDAYVQSTIELNNKYCSDYRKIDVSELKLPTDVELCVLDYDVYVPADFPGPDYGIVEPNMDFSQSNIGGGGIPAADGTSTYIGLGSNTMDIAQEEDPKYEPGNTYSFKNIFTMVKGYTDYVLSFISYPEGTKELSADVMYYGYFANK